MLNKIQKGDSVETVIGSSVKGGDVVILNDLIGIAVSDGDGENLRTVSVAGVFELKKDDAKIEQGQKVYFTDAKAVTATEGENTFLGYAWTDAAAGDETVHVKIG